MRCRLVVLGLGLVFSLACVTVPAVAQSATPPDTETASSARDAEGRGLFEAGRAAFEDGRYEDAAGYFERAYALSHRAELLYNVGSAYDRLRRDEEALRAFEGYVRELPDAPNAREVEARMRVLREAIAQHTTAEPDAAETTLDVEGDAATPADADAPLDGAAPPPAPAQGSGPGVLGEWWLWTIIGGVAIGAVVVAVVLATQGSSLSYPPYDSGTEGTTMTLTWEL